MPKIKQYPINIITSISTHSFPTQEKLTELALEHDAIVSKEIDSISLASKKEERLQTLYSIIIKDSTLSTVKGYNHNITIVKTTIVLTFKTPRRY